MRIALALRNEWPLLASAVTAILFLSFGSIWLSDLSQPSWFGFISVWLFSVILVSAFAVVRHAEELAVEVGEPLGTLVLTLAVTGMEVAIIAAVMATGHGNETVARDAMFAVVMIILNGMVGLSLLLGGLKHHEQTYNLLGANAFLAVIVPISVLGLVLPNFTVTSPGPTLSTFQAVFLTVMSIGLYSVFLGIQNTRHRDYFMEPPSTTLSATQPDSAAPQEPRTRSITYHAVMLLMYLLPVVILSKQLAVLIDYAIGALRAPAALGGFLVAVLVLSPESLAAVRAALANQLQRSVNILLGSVLATISLTIPAVLTIGLITGKTIVLGLDAADTTLLVLTLAVAMLTFAIDRTNVLLGAVHLLLFLAYLMLLFET